MKQSVKQILQNKEGSLQKTNKQNTEKIKFQSHILSECGCPDVKSVALFSLWRYSYWSEHPGGCRACQFLSLDLKAIVSHDQWTFWNPCIHLLIQLILLELLLYYLVAGLGDAEGKERHREVILNSVSLSMKAGGTIGMPASESTTANPPHTLTHHSQTRSFTQ